MRRLWLAVLQRGDVFQNVGPGGIGPGLALFATGHAHAVKEHLAQLLGAADVELLPGNFLNLILILGEFLGKGVGHARQHIAVHLNAGHLHLGQHGDQGTLQRFIDRGHLRAVQLGFEQLPQAQGDVGVFGGVFDRVVNAHPVKGDLRFAAAQERFDRDGLVAQILLGQRIHPVGVQARMHGVRQQHRVVQRRNADAVAGEDLPVIFHVLADFQDRRILEHRLQGGQRQ